MSAAEYADELLELFASGAACRESVAAVVRRAMLLERMDCAVLAGFGGDRQTELSRGVREAVREAILGRELP